MAEVEIYREERRIQIPSTSRSCSIMHVKYFAFVLEPKCGMKV